MSIENKIGIGAMRVTQLLNMRRSKAKTRSKNRVKTYKNLLQEMVNNVSFEKTKGHRLITSELEVDIVLACCNASKCLLVTIVLLCLYTSR